MLVRIGTYSLCDVPLSYYIPDAVERVSPAYADPANLPVISPDYIASLEGRPISEESQRILGICRDSKCRLALLQSSVEVTGW